MSFSHYNNNRRHNGPAPRKLGAAATMVCFGGSGVLLMVCGVMAMDVFSTDNSGLMPPIPRLAFNAASVATPLEQSLERSPEKPSEKLPRTPEQKSKPVPNRAPQTRLLSVRETPPPAQERTAPVQDKPKATPPKSSAPKSKSPPKEVPSKIALNKKAPSSTMPPPALTSTNMEERPRAATFTPSAPTKTNFELSVRKETPKPKDIAKDIAPEKEMVKQPAVPHATTPVAAKAEVKSKTKAETKSVPPAEPSTAEKPESKAPRSTQPTNLSERQIIAFIMADADTDDRTKMQRYVRTVSVLEQCGRSQRSAKKSYEKENSSIYKRLIDFENRRQELAERSNKVKNHKTLTTNFTPMPYPQTPAEENCEAIGELVSSGNFDIQLQ